MTESRPAVSLTISEALRLSLCGKAAKQLRRAVGSSGKHLRQRGNSCVSNPVGEKIKFQKVRTPSCCGASERNKAIVADSIAAEPEHLIRSRAAIKRSGRCQARTSLCSPGPLHIGSVPHAALSLSILGSSVLCSALCHSMQSALLRSQHSAGHSTTPHH